MIVRAGRADAAQAAELACLLWNSHSLEELTAEFAELAESGDGALFLLREAGEAVGFAQCSLRRDYVEGTASSPVGYLEGIFVRKEYRRRGFARELLAACQDWAREKGCTEFASDCELDNEDSRRFHLKMGFAEAERIVCFAKKL
ncbi:MAG: aminoglycoside 6'-N-acetyltransferase [Oscillospiraceae bacterium]